MFQKFTRKIFTGVMSRRLRCILARFSKPINRWAHGVPITLVAKGGNVLQRHDAVQLFPVDWLPLVHGEQGTPSGSRQGSQRVYALGIQRGISAMETPVRNPARKPTRGQAN